MGLEMPEVDKVALNVSGKTGKGAMNTYDLMF